MHTHGEEDDLRKKFELPGSRPHYPPSLSFTITHMRLAIEPDMQERSISCDQKLSITILQDTDVIELDAAELQIKSVSAGSKLDFRGIDDKLAVKLGRTMKEGSKIELAISYSAKPRQGFFFVAPDKHYPNKHLEAWTQGEATQAKHWIPCINHPQVKFSSEISVTVQAGFTAISNGKLQKVEQRGDRKSVV